ncbi:MAG: 30S ribosomal protein S17 [Candidatus Magasanikbacteria bacterium CG10_big_fil_rev_8_21_14_0_10_36_32]|uniref:Small ribosomal subunit protein uS17 n=1 Tax=Candidatus Magasanikbacteria bacterium CG10_big_fil_rev_8_21_14_0_10_36_32 TaxID=1974646 RepID=A0A2M6W6P4_9BACT|nr:MAG: 30S ribosomal protein S17 [Candidatus Magasanikbacteria bacterium CG10_big_fil_rev_8_21_14_0_10_36_32]
MDQDLKTIKKIKRELTGETVSVAMNKTITVNVENRKLHPKYKKFYRVNKKYHVHDEKSEAKMGDKVVFVECRPISKTKRWRLVKILNQK